MNKLTAFVFFCVTQLNIAVLFSQENPNSEKKLSDYINVNGYIKDLQSIYIFDGSDSIITDNLIHNRINFKAYLSKSLTVAFEIRNRVFYGETVKLTPGYGRLIDVDDGYFDLSWLIVDENALILHSMMDRVWLNWSSEKWDIRIGRQRINWGMNLLWNSNDLFNTYNFVDFDYEERPGTDALRVQRYLGSMSKIDVAIKPGRHEDDWVVAGLFRFNKWDYDFQLLGGWYYKDIAVGAGWAGNIKGTGFKGEVAYFHPQDNITDTSGVVSISVSMDYMFKSTLYVHGAVLFNNAGMTGYSSASTNLFVQPLSAKNLMPAKYAVLGQVSGSFTPLLRGDLIAVFAPGVNALFLMPSLTYSIKENWDISLHSQLFYMETADNFTSLGNGIFIRLKWSY